MFTDDILQFSYRQRSLNTRRINPFLSENNSIAEDVNRKDSVVSIENDMITREHFQSSQNTLSPMSPIFKIENEIKDCKQNILSMMDDTTTRDKLITKLISLNESLHLAKEKSKEEILTKADRKSVHNYCGHPMIVDRSGLISNKGGYCESCHRLIRTGRSMLNCSVCCVKIHNHGYCVQKLTRSCPGETNNAPLTSNRRFSMNALLHMSESALNLWQFPLRGNLAAQKFLCADCSSPIGPVSDGNSSSSHNQPALFCFYTSKYFCSQCHWNDKFFVPSVFFVLGVWKKLSVSRAAYLKLDYCWDRSLFRLPDFYLSSNSNAQNILHLRQRIMRMRHFRYECEEIVKTVTSQYPDWLIEQPYLGTMKFIYETDNATQNSITNIRDIYSSFLTHIPNCDKCKRLCKVCEICELGKDLIPGAREVFPCSQCNEGFVHESCLIDKSNSEYTCNKCTTAPL